MINHEKHEKHERQFGSAAPDVEGSLVDLLHELVVV
jgi:hypothetical protein